MLVFAVDRRVTFAGIPHQPLCGHLTSKPWVPMCVSEWQLECFSSAVKVMPTKIVTKLQIPFIYPVMFRSHVGGVWVSMQDFDKEISSFDWIDESVLYAMRAKRALLVLDDKSEGHPIVKDYLFKYLHMLASRLRVPEQTIVYVTSNLLAESKYERWAQQLEADRRVKIISDNWFAPDTYRNIWKRNRKFDSSLIERTFLCFNRHFNGFREHFVRDLMNEELVNKGYISLCAATPDDELALAKPETYFGWLSSENDREHYARESEFFLSTLPLTVDVDDFSHNHVKTINTEFYDKTLLSLITETWVHEDTVFITEKTYKAIHLLHPFIILGNPGILTQIRKYGFKTFSPFINEEYDDEPILEKRKNLIIRELHRLSNLSIEQQRLLASQLHEIAIHNKQHLAALKHSYGKPILEHFKHVTR